jgi:hypothetical protein
MGYELDAPQCAVCRERDGFGLLHETQSEASPAYWYCVECLEDLFERLRAQHLYPFLQLPPLPTPTWRPGRGIAKNTPHGRKTV